MTAGLLAAWLVLTQAPVADDVAAAEAAEDAEPAADAPVTQDQLEELNDKLAEVQAQLESMRTRQDWLAKFSVQLKGYLDFGFFWVQGNGSGVRTDVGHRAAPELQGQVLGSWVLVGDPASTAINSRGDVADIGDSRSVRFDPVHAGGRPSFMVNSLNVGISATLGSSLSLTASVDFLPRDRDLSLANALGDFVDIKLAYLRYTLDAGPLHFQLDAGKVESLLGIEYRNQDAPDRITVTPSIICRYTCGRPVGLRAIARFFDEQRLEFALALTNGSHQVDYFPFSNETEFNRWKTVAGRLGYRFPVGSGLELNVNGALGPQDRQTDDSVLQWHAGAAAQLEIKDFTVVAEAVIGEAQGKSDTSGSYEKKCGVAACLAYRGAYALVAWRASTLFMPYVRLDWRSARHRWGDQFAYVSDGMRATGGLRVSIGSHVLVKVEYTFNQELGPVSFPDDVFTSSLVVKY